MTNESRLLIDGKLGEAEAEAEGGAVVVMGRWSSWELPPRVLTRVGRA